MRSISTIAVLSFFTLCMISTALDIPDLPSGWTYSGCYQADRNTQYRGSDQFQGRTMTIQACANTCAARSGSIFAALNGDECTCNSTSPSGNLESDSLCDSKCNGWNSQMCGGQRDYLYTTVLRYNGPAAAVSIKPAATASAISSTQTELNPNIANPTSTSSSALPTTSSISTRPTATSPPPISSGISPSQSSQTLSTLTPIPSNANSTLIEITQYLPSPTAEPYSSSALSRSGLSTSSVAAASERPGGRYQNLTIIRSDESKEGGPRFKDQAELINIGSKISKGSMSKSSRQAGMQAFWMAVMLVFGLLRG